MAFEYGMEWITEREPIFCGIWLKESFESDPFHAAIGMALQAALPPPFH